MNSSNGAHRENTQKQGLLCVCPKNTPQNTNKLIFYSDEKVDFKNIIRNNIARGSIYDFKRMRKEKGESRSEQ